MARELRVVRWGLVPSWAKDTSIGSRMINARAETVAEKPSFRRAFARRRCLLPADGYYEWQVLAGEGSKKVKQPYFIYRADGGPLAFAGLYELWRDRQFPDGDPDAWLWTATIITTSAPDELGQIHDRMPMVIAAGELVGLARPGEYRAGRPAGPAGPGDGRRAGHLSGVHDRQLGPQQRPGADRAAAGRPHGAVKAAGTGRRSGGRGQGG